MFGWTTSVWALLVDCSRWQQQCTVNRPPPRSDAPPVFCRIRLVVAHGRIAVEMQSNRSCSHRINRPRRLRRLLLVALLTRLPWLLQQHQYHQHRSSGRKQTSGWVTAPLASVFSFFVSRQKKIPHELPATADWMMASGTRGGRRTSVVHAPHPALRRLDSGYYQSIMRMYRSVLLSGCSSTPGMMHRPVHGSLNNNMMIEVY